MKPKYAKLTNIPGEIFPISIGNKKNCCKEKKSSNVFSK